MKAIGRFAGTVVMGCLFLTLWALLVIIELFTDQEEGEA